MKIYNQNDYPDVMLGYSKRWTIATAGCKLCSISMIAGVDPRVMNERLKKAGCFFLDRTGDKCLLSDYAVADALGWKFLGRQTKIEPMPKLSPIIKEVDFSYRPGSQQHFVVRVVDKTGRYILDPMGGFKRAINFYEKRTNNVGWTKPGFSYRLYETNLEK